MAPNAGETVIRFQLIDVLLGIPIESEEDWILAVPILYFRFRLDSTYWPHDARNSNNGVRGLSLASIEVRKCVSMEHFSRVDRPNFTV